MVRALLEWEIPMSVTLPLQVQPDLAHQPFPFLDTTLADLGIKESDVKERVVWVDTKKTQVRNKAGKVKEKEITLVEVRVKAQKAGDQQLQEVLYSTEATLTAPSAALEYTSSHGNTHLQGRTDWQSPQMFMVFNMRNKLPKLHRGTRTAGESKDN
ncbi:uncharacterized protein si:ch211-196f5.2 [Thalassophryne amazonica]|uniref:uncharacterized protein si:ch211-196f5.2 n=1 Tax=Thalassophryne amazonica TaxID=390379 RepID=UPI0014722669|nr:uncharacterized protein si:ch211-196f5.2 [Thalassophryne amazonica]